MNNIEFTESGIQCDNPNCDYTNSAITYDIQHEWINKPCPKCGENLLTQEDHDRYMVVINTIALVNSLPSNEFEGMFTDLTEEQSNERVKIKIHTHNEIKIELDDQDD